jgi:hypothetical protein
MRLGADGLPHAEGDPPGTTRNRVGGLVNQRTGKIMRDVNPGEREGQVPVQRMEKFGPAVVYTATDNSPTAKWLLETASARQDAKADAGRAWTRFQPMLQEVVDHPDLPFELHVKANGQVSSRRIGGDEVLALSELVPADRAVEFISAGRAFVDAASDARVASEQLGVAGAELFQVKHFPDATRVTPHLGPVLPAEGERGQVPYERGTPNNFDDVLIGPNRETRVDTLVLSESKGGLRPGLGTRRVSWQGEIIDAEQGTTPYAADLLGKDVKLGPTLEELAEEGDELAQRVVTSVRGGYLESWLVHTNEKAVVTGHRTRLDTEYLRNVRISGIDDEPDRSAT